ncbi:MAG: NAD(P)/FAD-dependent oxidoreductase, partial [Cyanothece sp. SIO1E1]|nr:NAD(P)/FAD-dependent oxidoreductase [Cyanothece sp. SIO1E1]
VILEKSAHVLNKVRISGGGRCNVTHACFDSRVFATHYPRGYKALIGPLHRWDAERTIEWFEAHGVALKTEADGRMFPTTDDSQTILDCLCGAAKEQGIEVRTRTSVQEIDYHQNEPFPFRIHLQSGWYVQTRHLLIATGGTRSSDSASLLHFSGHTLKPAVPSLFTFNLVDKSWKEMTGLSVQKVALSIPSTKLQSEGPLLFTHWGLSGPAILKLSAWSARELHACDYRFSVLVDWLPGIDPAQRFSELRQEAGKRKIHSRSPFEQLPRRFWETLVSKVPIPSGTTWSQVSKKQGLNLVELLKRCVFEVNGKSMNKEEFVTCGGVHLDEVNLKTMESRMVPGLYFAGEVLDIDGITGGFNFQSAWTTGYLAGTAIAESADQF